MARVIDIEDLSTEIIEGKWGNGDERRQKLADAGLDYHVVQNYVNKKLRGTVNDDDYAYAEANKVIQLPDTAPTPKNSSTRGSLIPTTKGGATKFVPNRPLKTQKDIQSSQQAAQSVMEQFLYALRQANKNTKLA